MPRQVNWITIAHLKIAVTQSDSACCCPVILPLTFVSVQIILLGGLVLRLGGAAITHTGKTHSMCTIANGGAVATDQSCCSQIGLMTGLSGNPYSNL